MYEKIADNEIVQLFTKSLLFPAFIGIGIKLAVIMRKDKTKISLSNVCLSMLSGVGTAYIFSDLVRSNVTAEYQSITIAFIAIVADKIAEFLIYKFSVDAFITAVLNSVFSWISSGINNPKK